MMGYKSWQTTSTQPGWRAPSGVLQSGACLCRPYTPTMTLRAGTGASNSRLREGAAPQERSRPDHSPGRTVVQSQAEVPSEKETCSAAGTAVHIVRGVCSRQPNNHLPALTSVHSSKIGEDFNSNKSQITMALTQGWCLYSLLQNLFFHFYGVIEKEPVLQMEMHLGGWGAKDQVFITNGYEIIQVKQIILTFHAVFMDCNKRAESSRGHRLSLGKSRPFGL